MKISAREQRFSVSTVTIENPTARGFQTRTVDAVGGRAKDADVDGFVTKDEVQRFLSDFATEPKTVSAARQLLAMFDPVVVAVTLPVAHAPITRHHDLTFPDGEAAIAKLPPPLQVTARQVKDVVAHVDGGAAGPVERTSGRVDDRVSIDDVALALLPAHNALLRGAAINVDDLKALQHHLTTASTTRETVPQHPPEYVTKLPLKEVILELVTFGSLEGIVPAGKTSTPARTMVHDAQSFAGGRLTVTTSVDRVGASGPQAHVNMVNRYLQLTARDGVDVVLKTETRRGDQLVSSETVRNGHGHVDDIVSMAGVTEGAVTTLLAIVLEHGKVLESVQIELPQNAIVARTTDVHDAPAPTPSTPPATTAATTTATTATKPAPPPTLLGVTFRVRGLEAAIPQLQHWEPLTPAAATTLTTTLSTLPSSDHADGVRAIREILRRPAIQMPEATRQVLLAAVKLPLAAAFSADSAADFAVAELAGAARPLSASTAQALAKLFERLVVVEGDAGIVDTVKDLLAFGKSELSSGAVLAFSDFVAAMSARSKPSSVRQAQFTAVSRRTSSPASYQHTPARFSTVRDGIQVILPNHGLPALFAAAARGDSIVVGDDKGASGASIAARYDRASTEFVFTLTPGGSEPQRLSLASLSAVQALVFRG